VRYEIALEQEYQMVSGTVRAGGRSAKVERASLRGDQLAFEFTADMGAGPMKHQFSGTVADGIMSGTADLNGAKLQTRQAWSAALSR
jgi:hypothetical protein